MTTLHDLQNKPVEGDDLDDFVRTKEISEMESDYYGNGRYINLSEEENDRIDEYAETGSDGRTYQEVIDFWRTAVSSLVDSEIDNEDEDEGYIENPLFTRLMKDLDELEEWHAQRGTINKVIG
jgi:hypothetical protein